MAAISGLPVSFMPISQSNRRLRNRRGVYTGLRLTTVDDGYGHENTSSAPNSTHQIRNHG